MLKKQELSNPNSCLNRAEDDEPVFVILGRDPAYADAVAAWAEARVYRYRKNKLGDAQIQTAFESIGAAQRFKINRDADRAKS